MTRVKWFIAGLFTVVLMGATIIQNTQKQHLFVENLIANPGFENGAARWSETGSGTFAITTTATNVAFGSRSGSFDASAGSETLQSDAVTIPDGLHGRNCQASLVYDSTDGDYDLEVYDGTNIIEEVDLDATTQFTKASVNFICPTSGTLSLRLQSSADEAIIYLDAAYLGEATNLHEVSQAKVVGTLRYNGATNCSWTSTTASYVAFSADSDCNSTTVTGAATTPATVVPAVTFPSLAPGDYEVTAYGRFIANESSSGTQVCGFRLTDGTSNGPAVTTTQAVSKGNDHISSVSAIFPYSVAQGSTTFEVHVYEGGGNANCNLDVGTANRDLLFVVKRFPSDNQTALSIDNSNWYIDVNIGGANVSLGTSDQASYVTPNDASLDLVVNSGSQSAGISCSSTNDNTVGTLTCAAGSEEPGIVFNAPSAGTYEVCTEFTHNSAADNAGVVNAAFQLVNTANGSQTIALEGGSRIASSSDRSTALALAGFNSVHLCGIFLFTSTGKKTVRLMYEQSVAASVSSNEIIGDRAATNGQRDIHFTVKRMTQQINMPVIVDGVTVPGDGGVTAIYSAELDCDAASTITRENGDWISTIGNISSGACVVTLNASAFSEEPVCTVTDQAAANFLFLTAQSSTSLTIDASDAAGSAPAGWDANIICMGAK